MSNVQRFLDKVESNDNQGDSIAIISSWLQVAPSKVWITLVGDSKDAAVSTHTHTTHIHSCSLHTFLRPFHDIHSSDKLGRYVDCTRCLQVHGRGDSILHAVHNQIGMTVPLNGNVWSRVASRQTTCRFDCSSLSWWYQIVQRIHQ
jgi:hypothetical protein